MGYPENRSSHGHTAVITMTSIRALLMSALLLVAALTTAAAEPIRLVALGDSLTAGYGLSRASDALPARLEAALRARGHDVSIANAGVSGDTTTGGLARLDWAVGEDVDGVIVALGANDMLRGLDPGETEKALDAIVGRLTGRGQSVLVAGMLAAPNLGEEYGRAYNGLFRAVADRHGALFHPFLLEGVAAVADLNQADGIHPNEKGVAMVVEGLLPAVEQLIARIESSG
jgi:acyl-CoA thioesterase-1